MRVRGTEKKRDRKSIKKEASNEKNALSCLSNAKFMRWKVITAVDQRGRLIWSNESNIWYKMDWKLFGIGNLFCNAESIEVVRETFMYAEPVFTSHACDYAFIKLLSLPLMTSLQTQILFESISVKEITIQNYTTF